MNDTIKYSKGVLIDKDNNKDVTEIDKSDIYKISDDINLRSRCGGDFHDLGYYLNDFYCDWMIIRDKWNALVLVPIKKKIRGSSKIN